MEMKHFKILCLTNVNFYLLQVAIIFGLQNKKLKLYKNKDKRNPVTDDIKLFTLHAQTLYAYVN